MSSVPRSKLAGFLMGFTSFHWGSKRLNSKVHAEAAGPCPQALQMGSAGCFQKLGDYEAYLIVIGYPMKSTITASPVHGIFGSLVHGMARLTCARDPCTGFPSFILIIDHHHVIIIV